MSFDAGQGRLFGVPEWDDYSEDKQFVTIIAEDALGLQDIQQFELSVEPIVYPPVITQGSSQVVSIDEDETSVPWQLLQLNADYPNPDTVLLNSHGDLYPYLLMGLLRSAGEKGKFLLIILLMETLRDLILFLWKFMTMKMIGLRIRLRSM